MEPEAHMFYRERVRSSPGSNPQESDYTAGEIVEADNMLGRGNLIQYGENLAMDQLGKVQLSSSIRGWTFRSVFTLKTDRNRNLPPVFRGKLFRTFWTPFFGLGKAQTPKKSPPVFLKPDFTRGKCLS